MRNYCEEIAQEREQKTWTDQMIYQYPIGIETNRDLPKYLSDRLKDSNISLKLRFDGTSVMIDFNFFLLKFYSKMNQWLQLCHDISVPYAILPEQLLQIALEKDVDAYASASAYLLKVNGRLEYLLGNYQLIQYKVFIVNNQLFQRFSFLKVIFLYDFSQFERW